MFARLGEGVYSDHNDSKHTDEMFMESISKTCIGEHYVPIVVAHGYFY